jgi:sugar phosphate isomerase/epimerase
LRKAGYDGYLTIEREVGADPQKDIQQAVKFLRALLA